VKDSSKQAPPEISNGHEASKNSYYFSSLSIILRGYPAICRQTTAASLWKHSTRWKIPEVPARPPALFLAQLLLLGCRCGAGRTATNKFIYRFLTTKDVSNRRSRELSSNSNNVQQVNMAIKLFNASWNIRSQLQAVAEHSQRLTVTSIHNTTIHCSGDCSVTVG